MQRTAALAAPSVILMAAVLICNPISRAFGRHAPSHSVALRAYKRMNQIGDSSFILHPSSLLSQSQQDEEAKQYLTKWLNELAAASVRGDDAFFDNFMADDYTGTTTNGIMKDKTQWLADYRSHTVKFLSHSFDHIVVRVYGDTAVVTNHAIAVEILHGKKREGQTQNLRTFVKRDGRWQCVAFQSTTIK